MMFNRQLLLIQAAKESDGEWYSGAISVAAYDTISIMSFGLNIQKQSTFTLNIQKQKTPGLNIDRQLDFDTNI